MNCQNPREQQNICTTLRIAVAMFNLVFVAAVRGLWASVLRASVTNSQVEQQDNPNLHIGNRRNTVSESTVSNAELSEFLCPHRVLWGESSVSSSQPITIAAKIITKKLFTKNMFWSN